MPFDLKLHRLAFAGGATWTMEGPSWLDKAKLPVSRDQIREVWDKPSWSRDRYLLVTAEELRAMHTANGPSDARRATLSEHEAQSLAQFEAEMAKAADHDMYVMHWYEWSQG